MSVDFLTLERIVDLNIGLHEASKTIAASRRTAILNIIASFIILIATGILLTIYIKM